MKYVCLGYLDEKKWETMSEGEQNALIDECFTYNDVLRKKGHRAIAIAQHEGPKRGLEEICAIAGSERLAEYPFYHAALGEFELRCGSCEAAREHFRTALALARNPTERRFLEQRIGACERATPAEGR